MERKSKEDYPSLYEYRRDNQWKCYPKDDCEGYTKVVSFFCPVKPPRETFPADWWKGFNEGKPAGEVTGKVKQEDYSLTINTKKAVDLMIDRMYTSTRTKGQRRTLRKSFTELGEGQQYDWVALINYLRQAHLEGCSKVLLTKKEWAILQPPITKKEMKKRLQTKTLNSKLIGY